MDVDLARINRQMPTKKFSVHSTPCVIEHPSLSCSKISTKLEVASSRLAVAINLLSASFRPKGLQAPI